MCKHVVIEISNIIAIVFLSENEKDANDFVAEKDPAINHQVIPLTSEGETYIRALPVSFLEEILSNHYGKYISASQQAMSQLLLDIITKLSKENEQEQATQVPLSTPPTVVPSPVADTPVATPTDNQGDKLTPLGVESGTVPPQAKTPTKPVKRPKPASIGGMCWEIFDTLLADNPEIETKNSKFFKENFQRVCSEKYPDKAFKDGTISSNWSSWNRYMTEGGDNA